MLRERWQEGPRLVRCTKGDHSHQPAVWLPWAAVDLACCKVRAKRLSQYFTISWCAGKTQERTCTTGNHPHESAIFLPCAAIYTTCRKCGHPPPAGKRQCVRDRGVFWGSADEPCGQWSPCPLLIICDMGAGWWQPRRAFSAWTSSGRLWRLAVPMAKSASGTCTACSCLGLSRPPLPLLLKVLLL